MKLEDATDNAAMLLFTQEINSPADLVDILKRVQSHAEVKRGVLRIADLAVSGRVDVVAGQSLAGAALTDGTRGARALQLLLSADRGVAGYFESAYLEPIDDTARYHIGWLLALHDNLLREDLKCRLHTAFEHLLRSTSNGMNELPIHVPKSRSTRETRASAIDIIADAVHSQIRKDWLLQGSEGSLLQDVRTVTSELQRLINRSSVWHAKAELLYADLEMYEQLLHASSRDAPVAQAFRHLSGMLEKECENFRKHRERAVQNADEPAEPLPARKTAGEDRAGASATYTTEPVDLVSPTADTHTDEPASIMPREPQPAPQPVPGHPPREPQPAPQPVPAHPPREPQPAPQPVPAHPPREPQPAEEHQCATEAEPQGIQAQVPIDTTGAAFDSSSFSSGLATSPEPVSGRGQAASLPAGAPEPFLHAAFWGSCDAETIQPDFILERDTIRAHNVSPFATPQKSAPEPVSEPNLPEAAAKRLDPDSKADSDPQGTDTSPGESILAHHAAQIEAGGALSEEDAFFNLVEPAASEEGVEIDASARDDIDSSDAISANNLPAPGEKPAGSMSLHPPDKLSSMNDDPPAPWLDLVIKEKTAAPQEPHTGWGHAEPAQESGAFAQPNAPYLSGFSSHVQAESQPLWEQQPSWTARPGWNNQQSPITGNPPASTQENQQTRHAGAGTDGGEATELAEALSQLFDGIQLDESAISSLGDEFESSNRLHSQPVEARLHSREAHASAVQELRAQQQVISEVALRQDLKDAESRASRTRTVLIATGCIAVAAAVALTLGWSQFFSGADRPASISLVQESRDLRTKGLNSSALMKLDEAIKSNPDYPEAYFERARMHAEESNFAQAQADYSKAMELGLVTNECLSGRAEAAARTGDLDTARRDLAQLLGRTPKDVQIAVKLATIEHRAGDHRSAIDHLSSALEQGAAPRSNIYKQRGQSYLALKQADRAVQDFTQALAESPGDLALHALRGEARLLSGDIEGALADLEKASVRRDPAVFANKSIALAKLNKLQAAIDAATKAIELNRHCIPALMVRGECYLSQNAYQRALNDFDQVLAVKPDHSEARTNRDAALAASRRSASAVLPGPETEKLPPIPKGLTAEQLVAQGYQRMLASNFLVAIQYLSQAVKQQPNNRKARAYLAHALLKYGQPASAIKQFQICRSLSGGKLDPAEHMGIAEALLASGQAESARDAFEEILADNPQLFPARLGRIKAYVATGMRKRAEIIAQEYSGDSSEAERAAFQQVLKAGGEPVVTDSAPLNPGPAQDTTPEEGWH